MSVVAFIGMGANLGDRLGTLEQALEMIADLAGTKVLMVSRAYETEPWGPGDQPPYANAVAAVRTSLAAPDLLDALHEIEDSLGRVREERYGARTIDLDILLFGDEEWASERLTVPHPRLLEREFTVVPLLEIAHDATLPDGSPVTRDAAVHGKITGVLGTLGAVPPEPAPGDAVMPDVEPGVDSPEILEAAERAVRAPGQPPHRPVVPGDEWVELLGGVQGMLMTQQGSFDLQLKAGVLESVGIPVIIDPPPPLSAPGMPYYGAIEHVRLYVPASYEREARDVLGLPPRSRGREESPSPRPAEPVRDYTASYPRVWRVYALGVAIFTAITLILAFWDTLALLFS